MLPYWLLLTLPLMLAAAKGRFTRSAEAGAWLFAWLLFSLFIGLRHEVGADWGSYLYLLRNQAGKTIWEVISGGDTWYYIQMCVVVTLG